MADTFVTDTFELTTGAREAAVDITERVKRS
jgi:hypothetical protein